MNAHEPGALPSRLTLTLAAARAAVAAAEQRALADGVDMCIAVVDDGGHLVLFQRLDGTQIGSVDVAIAKARSAVSFRRPTKVFEDRVAGGSNTLLGVPGVLPLEGGVPLIVAGQIVGAIGASGGSPSQDGQVALAGASALAEDG